MRKAEYQAPDIVEDHQSKNIARTQQQLAAIGEAATPVQDKPTATLGCSTSSRHAAVPKSTSARSEKVTLRNVIATSRRIRNAADALPPKSDVGDGGTGPVHEASRAVASKGVAHSNATRARSSKSATLMDTTTRCSRKVRKAYYAPPSKKYVDDGGTRLAHEASSATWTRVLTSKGVTDSNATRTRSSKSATLMYITATSSRKVRKASDASPPKYVDDGGTRSAHEASSVRRTRAVTSKGVADSNTTRAVSAKPATPPYITAMISQMIRQSEDFPPLQSDDDPPSTVRQPYIKAPAVRRKEQLSLSPDPMAGPANRQDPSKSTRSSSCSCGGECKHHEKSSGRCWVTSYYVRDMLRKCVFDVAAVLSQQRRKKHENTALHRKATGASPNVPAAAKYGAEFHPLVTGHSSASSASSKFCFRRPHGSSSRTFCGRRGLPKA
ncbi:uncharacterized protein LOC125947315 [Dermacentor silvarum]|uniref:uncharacterized protein LOC125947315 n=1 Tax=Dermacentor silvarum TaxID=543639 RepID=UPI0021014411|nr:uncharacterized protein LOC125947315 [Dermacentor silvarum]